MPEYLPQLLARGDEVSVHLGRICIIPASGKPVPDEWLESRSKELIREILMAMGQDAYEYIGYSTGLYGPHKASGVTLQFNSLVDGEGGFACLNAQLKYSKGPRKGKPLPGKQFRIGERHELCKLWKSTGLNRPKRWASLHDYMGHLKQLAFVGVFKHGEKFANKTLRPLSVAPEQVRAALLPDAIRTKSGHHPDIARTKVSDKESAQAQAHRGLEPFPRTGVPDYGNKDVRVAGVRGSAYSFSDSLSPKEQSVDQWWADYEDATLRTEPIA